MSGGFAVAEPPVEDPTCQPPNFELRTGTKGAAAFAFDEEST